MMPESHIPIAAIQMSARASWRENRLQLRSSIEQAAAQGSRILLLPENFAAMVASDAEREALSHPDSVAGICDELISWAYACSVWLIAGGMMVREQEHGELPSNRCLVISPAGEIVTHYDKIHRFDANLPDANYRESQHVRAGFQPVMVDILGWRFGLSICYDIRFPELYRHYSRHGCHALLVPAAFTYGTGQAHWEVLLRARAIENQCYVIAAGQSGYHAGSRRTWGHSMIIDSWGNIISQCHTDDHAIVSGELNHTTLAQSRARMPSIEHRRMG